jgi:hypothetical protein
MLGQRPARRPATLEALHLDVLARRCGCRHLRHGFRYRGILFHIGERKLELLENRAPLRGLPKLLVAQLCNGELHLLDQQRAGARFSLGVQASRVSSNHHRLARLDVVGKRIAGQRHTQMESQNTSFVIRPRNRESR